MDSRLEKLIPARMAPLLSEAERGLLTFALDRFGEPLAGFLLCGLGEEEIVPEWRFAVTFTRQQGEAYTRELRVVADYRPDVETSVPRGREPLVLLALLRLLVADGEPASFSLSYAQEEVLGLLGWEDTPESRGTIDGAARRYFTLCYEWEMGEAELKECNLTFYRGSCRLVTRYGHEAVEEEGEVRRTTSEVEFDEQFVRELMTRSPFGINWDEVTALERVN